MPRRGVPPPCRQCPKIPLRAAPEHANWEYAADFTPEVRRVYEFYLRCKAVNRPFPEDELVELCAVRISAAERMAEQTWDARISHDSVAGLFEGVVELGRVTRGKRR